MDKILAAFGILGIPPDSTEADIRRAWRALVRTYHPDLAKTDPDAANRKLAEINAAVDAISAMTEAEKAACCAARAKAQPKKAARKPARTRRTQHARSAGQTHRKTERAGPKPEASTRAKSGPSRRTGRSAERPAQTDPVRPAPSAPMQHGLSARAAAAFEAAQAICTKTHMPRAPRASL